MFLRTRSHLQIGLFLLLVTFLFHAAIFVYVAQLDDMRQYTVTEYRMPVVPSDSSDYARLADNLLTHGTFSSSKVQPLVAEIHWPPGYPAFLAVTKFISGGFLLAVVVQSALVALVAYLMFAIGERFLPRALALIPPLLLIFDPSIAFYTVTIHSDVLFTALIMLLVYGMFFSRWSGFERPHVALFALWGVLLGCATLVRPIGEFLVIVLPVLVVAFFWNRQWNRELYVRYVSHMGVFAAGFLLVVTPWLMRNHEVAGAYMLADVGSKNLLLYNVKYFLTEKEVAKKGDLASLEGGGYAGVPEGDVVTAQLTQDLNERMEERGGEVHQHYTSVALSYILDDPLQYTKFHFINTAPYFLAGSIRHYVVSAVGPFKERAGLPYPQHTNIANHISTILARGSVPEMFVAIKALSLVLVEVGYRALLVLCALCALLVKNQRARNAMVVLWILVLYFAILTGPVAFTRYRIVSEPYLLLLATVGVSLLFGYAQICWRGVSITLRGRRAVRQPH